MSTVETGKKDLMAEAERYQLKADNSSDGWDISINLSLARIHRSAAEIESLSKECMLVGAKIMRSLKKGRKNE